VLQLKDDNFDVLFVSPLTRAKQTADIVAAGRDLPTTMLPSLREIDLYSFQVLLGKPALAG
jgi:probable phosphoglycerate mutase